MLRPLTAGGQSRPFVFRSRAQACVGARMCEEVWRHKKPGFARRRLAGTQQQP
jgi:hypothetical protein